MSSAKIDTSGRYVFLNGNLDGTAVMLVSIYAPNSAQLDYIEQTLAKLAQFKTGQIILGGDLNVIADKHLDRQPSTRQPMDSPSSKSKLQLIFEKYDLLDIWRQQHPMDKDYTYFSDVHQVYTCIDYILLSRTLLPYFLTLLCQ